MRTRFTEAMRASYGAKDLDELFDYMDIVLIPPNLTVVSSHNPGALGGTNDGTTPPYLYVLDRGHISAYATLGSDIAMGRGAEAGAGVGSSGQEDISLAKGEQNNPRHRLAKYGAGAILGVAAFVTPDDMPDLNIMPTAAISDTYCQLLRLPRSRCDELEKLRPALVFRLYRLLVLISERRLQDHRMRVVASEAFKINVLPSTNFQRMLVGGGTQSQALSASNDQLQQYPPLAAMAPAAAPAAADGSTSRSSVAPGSGHSPYGAGDAAAGSAYGRPNERGDAALHIGSSACNSTATAPAGHRVDGMTLQPLVSSSGGSNAYPGPPASSPFDNSPNATPLTTPTLDRRSEAFPGPALNLFSSAATSKEWADSGIPLSQSYPGREPLPVASLQSFQSAMLAELNETQEGNGDGDAAQPEAERPKEKETFTDFLWPKSRST